MPFQSIMNKIRHILFDCDGVLVDTEYTAAVKMCEALRDAGASIDLDHYLQVHSGTTFSGILEHYFGNSMSAEDKVTLMNRVEADVAAAVKPVIGIPELLTRLDVNKSVVSNSSIATVEHALDVTRMADFFSNRIFSSEQVPKAKPAPDLYYFTIESLGLRPEEILVVEDSRTGVQAATSAGLSVIGFGGASHIRPGHEEKLQELGAVHTAIDAASLEQVLQSYLQ